MKFQLFVILVFLFSIPTIAQSDINSPYSLFGIGKENSNYFGGSSGLANTGIGYSNGLLINKINPASLTSIDPTSFLYDIGINTTISAKIDNESSQKNYNFNFTNFAIAFSASDRWKMSFGLVPKTKTSYDIDLIEPAEGNTNYYYTNVVGSGGVNEFFWGQAFKVTKNLSLGVEFLAYFGSINQERSLEYDASFVYLDETKRYSGVGLNGGFQYNVPNLFGTNTTFGGIASLPSKLNGTEDISGSKTVANASSISIAVIDETDVDIDDANIPLKIGFGITSQFRKLTFNLDYRKNYWSNTAESTSNFVYRDQNLYGLGVEYKRQTNSFEYYRKIIYRMGVNYDSGYLTVNNNKIDNYVFSAGVGFPIPNSGSSFNLSYTYGKEGTLSNNLVMDNYHKITLNVSLVGKWFQQKKIY